MADKSNDALVPRPTSFSSHTSVSRLSSCTENSQARTDISNAFSHTVKLEVSRLSSGQCWSCSTTDPEFAHVIAQKDGQVDCWKEAGLLPFSLKAVTNCVQLCPTCHTAFDRSDDPHWVFLPTDLNFFIKYEVADRQRRAETDEPSYRIVPTAKEYHNHLTSKGLVPDDAIGGLYRGYYLKNFLYGGRLPIDLLRSLTAPKPWHGHPLATIRRGIAILGSARCHTLDQTTIDELSLLRDLYFNDKYLIHPHLIQLYHTLSGDSQKRTDEDSDETDHHNKKKLKLATNNNRTVQHVINPQDTSHICSQSTVSDIAQSDLYTSTEWVLGPSATGNDAIDRFAPLFK
ncbi:unnamed protein product [Penicillium palitans]